MEGGRDPARSVKFFNAERSGLTPAQPTLPWLESAEITATRFVNEYQWGDLKGDPLQMVTEDFDAFLYLANWGTRQVMLRLPRGCSTWKPSGGA